MMSPWLTKSSQCARGGAAKHLELRSWPVAGGRPWGTPGLPCPAAGRQQGSVLPSDSSQLPLPPVLLDLQCASHQSKDAACQVCSTCKDGSLELLERTEAPTRMARGTGFSVWFFNVLSSCSSEVSHMKAACIQAGECTSQLSHQGVQCITCPDSSCFV